MSSSGAPPALSRYGGMLLWALLLFPVAAGALPPDGHFIFEPQLSDEFSGERLDLTLWENDTPHTIEHFLGRVHPDNVELRDGAAHLWIRKEGPSYTWPWLRSKTPLRYGYVEMRARLAWSLANQSLWLYRWTPTGSREIDIFEIAPAFKKHERSIFTNLHVYDGPAEQESTQTRRSFPKEAVAPDFDPTVFNTYGFSWTSTTLTWYLNGKAIRQEPNRYFHAPMHLISCAGVHPGWFGIPTDEMLKTPMVVDYIRTWRWAGSAP